MLVKRLCFGMLVGLELLLLQGCQSDPLRSGSRRPIKIVMKDASGLQRGTSLYLRGVNVGSTRDPRVEPGGAIIEADLNGRASSGIPPCTEFVVKTDPVQPQKNALIAVLHDQPADPLTCRDGVYAGFPSESARMGAKAGEIFNSLKSLIQ